MKLKNIYHILFALFLSACGPLTLVGLTPASDLPDLVITSAHVSMVDNNGHCLGAYGFILTVANEGNASAPDVLLVEASTGHQIDIGTMSAFQSITVPIPAVSPNGTYTLIADPQNLIVESNESNNSFAYFDSTATPPADCPLVALSDATPVPFSPSTPVSQNSDGLIYTDMNLGQILKISPDGQGHKLFDGIDAKLTEDGGQAILELNGDLIIANSTDNSSVNITNTPDRFEIASRWWAANPAQVVFNSRGNNEAQEKGWNENIVGYLSIVNEDGSEYTILENIPSYTSPSLSAGGSTIAYDRSGAPMLYELGIGARPFDPTLYGYQPSAESVFTSPSYAPDGLKLTWWVLENISQSEKKFSLVIFDLLTNTSSTLHTYAPLPETLGWLPSYKGRYFK